MEENYVTTFPTQVADVIPHVCTVGIQDQNAPVIGCRTFAIEGGQPPDQDPMPLLMLLALPLPPDPATPLESERIWRQIRPSCWTLVGYCIARSAHFQRIWHQIRCRLHNLNGSGTPFQSTPKRIAEANSRGNIRKESETNRRSELPKPIDKASCRSGPA